MREPGYFGALCRTNPESESWGRWNVGADAHPAKSRELTMELRLPDHAHCGALTGLVRSAAERLTALRPVPVRAGEVIYRQGDATERLFVVVSGLVRTSVLSRSGRAYVLADFGPGDAFGEVCFCEIRARQEQAVAAVDSLVLPVGPAELIGFAASGEKAVVELLEMFSHRLAETERRLEELALEGVRARIIGLLLRVAPRDLEAGGFVELAEVWTHDEIAARIPTTREQVTTVLGELRKRGAIDYGRGRAMRVRRERLEEMLSRDHDA